jgi:hypothetical protein
MAFFPTTAKVPKFHISLYDMMVLYRQEFKFDGQKTRVKRVNVDFLDIKTQ